VAVQHELTGRATGRGETETVHQVVHAGFEQLEQDLARDAFAAQRLLEEALELELLHAELTAQALLLAELLTELGHLATAARAVLTGSGLPLLDRALGHIAPGPFEKQLLPLAPANAANGTCISAHVRLSSVCADGSHCEESACNP
jgi:hypothetical protein